MTPLRAVVALLVGGLGLLLAGSLLLPTLFSDASQTRIVAPFGFLLLGPLAVALLARSQRWAWVGVSLFGVVLACAVWFGVNWVPHVADTLLG